MSEAVAEGRLRKMRTTLRSPVEYSLPLGETEVPMNALLGARLRLTHDGRINCIHCGRETKKSFNQGYCYPCFTRLARCDSCILSPAKCHYDAGTCREPEWGEEHCMIEHCVYLANTSGLKVGITRANQVPTRWMDQGAVQALPIFRVRSRHQSGLVETAYARHTADRTNWRAMLRGETADIDLPAERDRLLEECRPEIEALQSRFGLQAIQPLADAEVVVIGYPVREYPVKVSSHDLDKTGEVAGRLAGIKGQYLTFHRGAINIRKYGGYHLRLRAG